MNKPNIISGEASETESEDEAPKQLPKKTSPIQGAAVTGEDSESENENDASICSAVSALAESPKGPTNDSLLHQKLRECNGKLHHDLETLCNGVVGEAGKSLSAIDQHLIKSQLTVQNAVTSLKSLANNSLAIKNKLQSLLSAQFIPNIKIHK